MGNTDNRAAKKITQRAGRFLDRAYPGPNRNKRIADQLNCSADMVKVLRAGRGWTAVRLAQLTQRFGWDFLGYVFGPVAGDETRYAERVNQRLDYLRGELDRLARDVARGPLAAPGSGTADVGSLRGSHRARRMGRHDGERIAGEAWVVTGPAKKD